MKTTGTPRFLALVSALVILGSLSTAWKVSAAPSGTAEEQAEFRRRPTAVRQATPQPTGPVTVAEQASIPSTVLAAGFTTVTHADGLVVKTLGVPYVNQVYDLGADLAGDCSCGPASLAMVLAYFGRVEPRSVAVQQPVPHTSWFGWVVTSGHIFGSRAYDRQIVGCEGNGGPFAGLYGALMVSNDYTGTEWQRMNDAITDHGLTVTNYGGNDLTLDVVKQAIDRGHPVILTTGLTGAGHIVVAVGYTSDNRLVVNDPYGDKNAGYPNDSGEQALYTWADFGGVPYSWEVGGTGEGWLATYRDSQGNPVTRFDREIDFDWGLQSPTAPLPAGDFAAHWTQQVWFKAGQWKVTTTADTSIQIKVDGRLLVTNDMLAAGNRRHTMSFPLASGLHTVDVQYDHRAGTPAGVQVSITPDTPAAQ